MMAISMRRLLTASALCASVLVAGGPAQANDCGNVTEAGVCLDTKTLNWCDDGVIKQMVCPAGEVCVAHQNFNGSHGCIGTAYTGCGDVTEAGECSDSGHLIWCDADKVRERDCADGSICDWVEDGDDGYYDCVPDSDGEPAGNPDAGATDEDDVIEPVEPDPNDVVETPPVEMVRQGPVPQVQQGGAGPAQDLSGGGGAGCATGPADAAWPLALVLVIGWITTRRTRRSLLGPG